MSPACAVTTVCGRTLTTPPVHTCPAQFIIVKPPATDALLHHTTLTRATVTYYHYRPPAAFPACAALRAPAPFMCALPRADQGHQRLKSHHYYLNILFLPPQPQWAAIHCLLLNTWFIRSLPASRLNAPRPPAHTTTRTLLHCHLHSSAACLPAATTRCRTACLQAGTMPRAEPPYGFM